MDNNKIKPEKITKPIQLLAVWLTGLILLVSTLLTAAGTVNKPEWLPVLFGISAVFLIPIVLVMVFLLQTKFRPEMQEDTFYSEYLDKITQERFSSTSESINNELEFKFTQLNKQFLELTEETKKNLENIELQIDSSPQTSLNKLKIKSLIQEADKKIARNDLLRLTISLNNKISEYKQIRNVIAQNGIKLNQNFGDEIPSVKLYTVGRYVSPATLLELLDILKPYGFDFINRTSLYVHDNSVVIGSYAYKNSKIIPITDELVKEIESINTSEQLNNLLPDVETQK